LVVNTHLDPQDPRTQIPQLQQCVQVRVLPSLKHFTHASHQFIRASLQRAAKEFQVLPANTAVLLTGDFNIPASSNLFQTVLKELGDAKDLYGSIHGRWDTEATYDAKNSLNKWKETHRIDFAFAFDSIDGNVALLRVNAIKAQILKQSKGEELSDHWGQVFELQLA